MSVRFSGYNVRTENGATLRYRNYGFEDIRNHSAALFRQEVYHYFQVLRMRTQLSNA
jgi:hypothetical protein